MTDSQKKGGHVSADFRVVKEDESTEIFFEIESKIYSIFYSVKFYTRDHNKKKVLPWKEVAAKLGVSEKELTKVTDDAQEYMVEHGLHLLSQT